MGALPASEVRGVIRGGVGEVPPGDGRGRVGPKGKSRVRDWTKPGAGAGCSPGPSRIM